MIQVRDMSEKKAKKQKKGGKESDHEDHDGKTFVDADMYGAMQKHG